MGGGNTTLREYEADAGGKQRRGERVEENNAKLVALRLIGIEHRARELQAAQREHVGEYDFLVVRQHELSQPGHGQAQLAHPPSLLLAACWSVMTWCTTCCCCAESLVTDVESHYHRWEGPAAAAESPALRQQQTVSIIILM